MKMAMYTSKVEETKLVLLVVELRWMLGACERFLPGSDDIELAKTEEQEAENLKKRRLELARGGLLN